MCLDAHCRDLGLGSLVFLDVDDVIHGTALVGEPTDCRLDILHVDHHFMPADLLPFDGWLLVTTVEFVS